MPLEDFVYTILEFICAFASLSLMIILQTSKEKYFHNNFFCIFKVTAAYGVINLLTSVGYRICSTNLVLYIIRNQINVISSLCFCTGCLLMEIQRFLVLRSPTCGDNIVSARKLYLIFVGQFLFFAIVMSPWLFIQLDWIDECINYIRRPHRGNILILASAYCSYCIFSAFLTTLTIRQLRKKRTNMKRIMNTSQLILVRYAIYCSFAHFLKGAILLARVTTYFMDTSEEFLSELTITLFYPINIFTISSTSFLLVILSHNVRSKLKKVLCCSKKNPIVTSITSRIENRNSKIKCNSSARKLYLIFVFQFILSFLAMSPNLFASVKWKNGCIDYLERKKQRVLITIVASAYCSYFVFSAFLTTQTMRRMRETPESVRQRINARQLSLVRYTIYCSIAQFLKGVILFLRVSTYIWDTDKFLLNLANAMFYPINIFTVSSTFWLLIIFSNSVRRGLRMVSCRSTAAPATISTASRDNDGRRYSLSQH